MKIALLGDIALFGKYDVNKNPDVYVYFEDVAKLLDKFDYVIGNLETPFTKKNSSMVCKSAHIKTDYNNVNLLKYLNIGIVNLANNHLFDYGVNGYKSTLKILEENGINYFGIESKQIYLENEKVALSGFCCYSSNASGYYKSNSKYGVNILDGNIFEKTIKSNNEKGYLNIVSVHFGDEHIHYPRYEHIKLARKVAKHTPYIFYGHHPHVMQGIEMYENALIAYSLGNFCFDDVYTKQSSIPKVKQTQENKESFILSLEIEANELKHYEIIPIYDNNSKIIVDVSNSEILNKIYEYTRYLNLDEDTYRQIRQYKLNEYLSKRKSMRNVKWYIERLNYNTAGMLIKAKINLREYKKCLKDYL